MAYGTRGRIWDSPNATIPYEIDSNDFPTDSAQRAEVDRAIAEWNENTVIRLIPKTDEHDYIVFGDSGSDCHSKVGKAGGRQFVTCDLEGGFSAKSLMHEIGHAVGFHHEQQRPDRGSFVRVGRNSDGVNCDIIPDDQLLTDYDCESIMHYSTGGCGSITPLTTACNDIGNAVRLSGRDVWGAGLLYHVEMNYAVAWEDLGDGKKYPDIHMSGFSQSGRRFCGPVRVNRLATGQQQRPAVGLAGNRDMVYVWADDAEADGSFEIRMRGFSAKGRQLFSQRTVNVKTAGNQTAPDVAVAKDGRFVVVWQDDTDQNGVCQIKARGFNSDGSERFPARTINRHPKGQQTAPRVAIAPDGFFVVVWEHDEDNDGRKSIRMRGFHADGTERWKERRVNTRTSGQSRRPKIAMGPFGDFVIVWEDDSDNNGFYQIRMRAFTADRNAKFSERTVNTVAAGQQLEPDVAVDDVFRPVVVWADDSNKNGVYEIKMRGFESNGTQRFPTRLVNSNKKGQQRRPAIGMGANGQFIVAWEDDADLDGRADIFVRGFSSVGEELFSSRHVSNIPNGHKSRPCVAALPMDLIDLANPF